MEIPPQIQSLLSKLSSNAARDQSSSPISAEKLLDLKDLKAGTQLQAQVASVKALSVQEKTTLFDFLQSAQQSKQQGATSPGLFNMPLDNSKLTNTPLGNSNKTALEQLIAKPELYLIKLKLEGKALSTISNVLLQTKQWVAVTKRDDGQLQLQTKPAIPSPAPAAVANTANTTSTKSSALYSYSKSSDNLAANNLATNASKVNTPQLHNLREKLLNTFQNQQLMNTLTAGLRQYMPQEKPLADTFKVLQALNKAIQAEPQTTTGNKNATQAPLNNPTIKALLDKAFDIERLQKPAILQQAVSRSGLSLEAKLRSAASQLKQLNLPQNNSSALSNKIGADAKSLNTSSPEASRVLREQAVPYDVKTTLLQTLNSVPPLKVNAQNQQQLSKLFQPFFAGLTQQDLVKIPAREFEQRLNSIIRTWVMSGIARITGLQLRHLINSLQDSNVSGAGGMYELPLRFGETFYPVVLHIQERYHRDKDQDEEDKESTPNKKSKLKSSWHVYLEFDLDEYGLFASDITLMDNNIKTQFWIQQSPLWSKSKNHINELRKALEEAGIRVEEMLCTQGTPPDKSMNLQHALVDIRT